MEKVLIQDLGSPDSKVNSARRWPKTIGTLLSSWNLQQFRSKWKLHEVGDLVHFIVSPGPRAISGI